MAQGPPIRPPLADEARRAQIMLVGWRRSECVAGQLEVRLMGGKTSPLGRKPIAKLAILR